jgi:two-component system sensor histidine kinase YesM
MNAVSSFLRRLFPFFRDSSIKRKIRTSYFIIIGIMLAPPLINIGAFLFQTLRYDMIITNVSKTNRLNQTVKTEITNEIWDIIAGNKKFSDGRQYKIIHDIMEGLGDIKATTAVTKNRELLEVAGRAVDTLEQKVDILRQQIESSGPVSENEKVLDEIRGVSALVSDILQDFIVLEIESAAMTNESMKKTALFLTFLQIITVVFVMLFALVAQRSVSASINKPIKELEKLSTRIAEGDLLARADAPHVKELDNLTENLNTMARKIEELIADNIQEQKNLQKSEMKALQAQITPHFLYNTFDTIIWLAEGRQYDQVIDVTRAFSNFFRISLNRGKDWLTVEQEFEHIKSYLTIQKIRYRDILDYTIEYEPGMAGKSVLKLLLQPLVENALYHGIKNKRGRGELIVKGWMEDGFLFFKVSDNGIGMTPEVLADVMRQMDGTADPTSLSNVYGLYNVNKRLELYYNNKETRLQFTSVPKEGTTVIFKVPEVSVHV